MKHAARSTCAGGVTVIVAALLIYSGMYFFLITPKYEPHTGAAFPRYKFGDDTARWVFLPAHAVDRRLRPGTWPDGDWSQVDHEAQLGINVPNVEQATVPPVLSYLERYDDHMKAASRAYFSGDSEQAIEEFTAAIEANPEGYEAYITRGVVHQELGNWQAAMADYEKALEINPDDYASWNNIAMLLAACPDDAMRNGAKAAEYAQRACELTNWEHPATLNTLAIAYAELGDWQAATDICDEQLGKHPDDPTVEEFRLLLDLFKQEKPYRLKGE